MKSTKNQQTKHFGRRVQYDTKKRGEKWFRTATHRDKPLHVLESEEHINSNICAT